MYCTLLQTVMSHSLCIIQYARKNPDIQILYVHDVFNATYLGLTLIKVQRIGQLLLIKFSANPIYLFLHLFFNLQKTLSYTYVVEKTFMMNTKHYLSEKY